MALAYTTADIAVLQIDRRYRKRQLVLSSRRTRGLSYRRQTTRLVS